MPALKKLGKDSKNLAVTTLSNAQLANIVTSAGGDAKPQTNVSRRLPAVGSVVAAKANLGLINSIQPSAKKPRKKKRLFLDAGLRRIL